MTAPDTHLERITLTNYRCFDQLEIDLHPRLTVLTAHNGGGKTAILDAIATSLRPFVDAMRAVPSHGIDPKDVRRVSRGGPMIEVLPTEIHARGVIDGQRTQWRRKRASLRGRTTHAEAHEIVARGEALRQAVVDHALHADTAWHPLPVIAYYGTGRLWNEHKLTAPKKRAAEEIGLTMGAYLDALSPSSSYWHFNAWYGRVSQEAYQEAKAKRKSPHRPDDLLFAVNSAVEEMLQPTGWNALAWDPIKRELVAVHSDHGQLPVAWLSDGIRNMIALVADVAQRLARLNVADDLDCVTVCQDVPGIVLIDEVDMHLHPEWQQVILPSLQATFPRVQFIVTTHSPQVLSTVPRECIRIIEQDHDGGWRARSPEAQTEGVQSALVMASVMGVDSMPDNEHVRRLREYGTLIATGHAHRDDARALRRLLDAHFGPQSAVMLDCDRVIRLEDMKRRMLKREGA